MNKRKIFIFILFCLVSILNAEELIKINITIKDTDKNLLKKSLVKIGDLQLETNEEGKISTELYPALYDIEIEKNLFFKLNTSIEVGKENYNFEFELESRVADFKFKITDSITEKPIIVSAKFINKKDEAVSFYFSDSTGIMNAVLDKRTEYTIEIDEKNYQKFNFETDTSNLNQTLILFKLERKESEAAFSSNIENTRVTLSLDEKPDFVKNVIIHDKNMSKVVFPSGIYTIKAEADMYKPFIQSIDLNKSKIIDINLEPNFKLFKIKVFYSLKPGIVFLEKEEENLFYKKNVEDTLITIVSKLNSKKKYQIKYENTKENEINIEYGTYNIKIETGNAEQNYEKEIILNSDTNKFMVFYIQENFAVIKGTVESKEALIGGIKIIFSDEQGNIYDTTSSIDGSFFIKLPPFKYEMSILKEGFRLSKDVKYNMDFSEPGKNYIVNLGIEEIPSIISGNIKTLSGKPVNNAKITMRVGKDEKYFYTDENGNYSVEMKSGLVFIKVEKAGLKPKGTIKNLDKFSTVKNMDFKLEEIFSKIEGIITDGVSPLSKMEIKLQNIQNNEEYIVVSKNDGSFIFENIPVLQEYILKINNNNYIPYVSDKFLLSANPVLNYNVILKKNSLRIILELVDKDNNILKNIRIILNQTEVFSDINGIVDTELNIGEEIEEISVEIPEFSYKENFKPDKNVLEEKVLRKKIELN